MSHQPVPSAFAHLTDLSADATGTFVVYATDDYFAPKENLVRPDAPVWKEGEYTDKGKWMDGWESQRMRGPASWPLFMPGQLGGGGHDYAIVRLGTPGQIHGFLCDTTHFKGNAPQAVALDVCEMPHTATAEDLNALPFAETAEEFQRLQGRAWWPVLNKKEVKADFQNVLALPQPSLRATHVRLCIFPDGGVSRLRVYGVVQPEPRTFWQPAAVDLVAIEHGGTIAAVSDQFFGPPSNLTLPGRGVNMGDGWETKRRRTPGSDWCVLKLGRRGVVQRLEIDTHFFKGNAPQFVLVEALDETEIGAEALQDRLREPLSPQLTSRWDVLVEETPLVQHRRHVLEPSGKPREVTHLRVHIFPHGGVNRMRVFGLAADTPEEAARLQHLADLPVEEARTVLLSFNGSARWAERMLDIRPFPSVREWFELADAMWWSLEEADFLQAFAAHPRIGQGKKAESATEKSAEWSRGEQSGVQDAEAQVKARLAELNDRYFDKFGFIFICFATGRSAAEMLRILERRIANTRAQEVENAAREQARITRLRMEKWLLGR